MMNGETKIEVSLSIRKWDGANFQLKIDHDAEAKLPMASSPQRIQDMVSMLLGVLANSASSELATKTNAMAQAEQAVAYQAKVEAGCLQAEPI